MGVPRSFKDRICTYLGVPYVGDVFCLIKDRADNYYKNLSKQGFSGSSIQTDFQAAENLMTTDSGDVLVLFPGDHVVTSSTTWDKDVTYIIGAGPRYQAYQPGTLTNGGTRLTCTTAGVSEIVNITGHYVTTKGFGTYNSADSATSYCDIRVSGKNAHLNEMSMRGGNGTTQLATIGAGVPLIVDTSVSGAGNGLLVENSILGSSGNSARTKGPGCIQFKGGTTSTGFGMHFKNCTLSTRIETAANNSVGLVQLYSAGSSADRELLFENSGFYNFWENFASALTYAIRDACTTTHQIILQNCWANKGITNWTDAATFLSSSTAQPNLVGGIGVNA